MAFYKQLVPEAFVNDKVHLQKLWDGLVLEPVELLLVLELLYRDWETDRKSVV